MTPRGEPLLLVLLLSARLEAMPQRERIDTLRAAPGVVAVDPPRMRLPPTFAAAVAPRQAKRMKLPGVPRAIAVFDELQIALAGALIMRHPDAELWSLTGPEPQADFVFDLAAAPDLRPAWERLERLGIESGRLGSERAR
jgi:hypothetical protein